VGVWPPKQFDQLDDGMPNQQQCFAAETSKQGHNAEAEARAWGSTMKLKVQLWVAKPLLLLERVTVRVYAVYPGSLIWRACCTSVMWPVHLAAGVPMLLLYSGVCKSLLADADQGFMFFHPERVYVLYDRLTGSIEAPVGAGLYVMLLVMGVQPRNVYVVEQPVQLYAALCFSIFHMLYFWWDMVHIASTSLSWRQWWTALTAPFKMASIRECQPCSRSTVVPPSAGPLEASASENRAQAGEWEQVRDVETELVSARPQ
jgi:hypothetical protein